MMTSGEMGQDVAAKADRIITTLLEGVRPKVVINGNIVIAEMPDGRIEQYRLNLRILYPCREPEEIGHEQAAA